MALGGTCSSPGLLRIISIIVSDQPNVLLLRAFWSVLDGIWGVLKGSWGVLGVRSTRKKLEAPLKDSQTSRNCHIPY